MNTPKKKIENRLKSKTETDILLSTKANAKRLAESIKQDQQGKVIQKKNN